MFNRLLSFLALFLAVPACAVNITPGMTTPQIQAAITSAAQGSTVSFAAGAYSITAPIAVPCANLALTGPVATPATAVLTATFPNDALFAYPGNCSQLGSVSYLGIVSNGGLYFGIGNNGNFTFTHNQVTGLQTAAGLFFDGTLATTLSKIAIQYNTFGDQNSCAAIFQSPTDMGGYCAGVITSQGKDSNLDIESNTFNHVEEGIHFNQMAAWNPGTPGSVCVSCVIDSNYIVNYHRIGIEVQVGTPTNPVMLEHNVVLDPLNSSYGTFAVSLACCQWNTTLGTPGNSPGLIFNDNVLVASQPCGAKCPPYGVEFWGTGSQGLNSLVQGSFSNGYTWGYGAGAWAINNNYICGPNYVNSTGSYYISNQQSQNNPPSQTGNTTSPACHATPSSTPALAPSGGTYQTPQVVTMSEPAANTLVWYTLDGSTPAPGTSKQYTGPITISASTLVKAIGMWGGPNQPTSYPVGYGYVPSGVVSATYTIGSATKPAPPVITTIVATSTGSTHTATVYYAASANSTPTVPGSASLYRATGACTTPNLKFSKVVGNMQPAGVYIDSTVAVNTYCYYLTATIGGVESNPSGNISVPVPPSPPTTVLVIVPSAATSAATRRP